MLIRILTLNAVYHKDVFIYLFGASIGISTFYIGIL